MPSSTSILGLSLALMVNQVFAAPLTPVMIITEGPPQASAVAALAARSAPPDFGTETISASVMGEQYTFVHHFGINFANFGDNDEVILVSAPLLAALEQVTADTSMCPVPAPKKARDLPEQNRNLTAVGLQPRDDDPVLDQLVLGACTESRIRWILENMAPAGDLVAAIPGVLDGDALRDFVAGPLADAFERLYARFDTLPILYWVVIERRRAAVMALLAFIISLEQNYRIIQQVTLSHSMYQSTPDEAKECLLNENAPACPDADCHGQDGKCTAKANIGCVCYPILEFPLGHPFNKANADIQQKLMDNIASPPPPNGSPQCGGLGSSKYIDRDSAFKCIQNFCTPYGGLFPGPGNSGENSEFGGKDEAYWLRLKIDWTTAFEMPGEDCTMLLTSVLDGCDGNSPDNPFNLKYGGTITHGQGAILSLLPLGGANPRCDGYGYQKNVDDSVAVDKVTHFCNEQSLTGHAGTRVSINYNQNAPQPLTVTALWAGGDYSMFPDDCITQFRVAIDGCDGNDPINNPGNLKFGGTYTNSAGVLFEVWPTSIPPTFPPDEIGTDGQLITPVCDSGDKSVWPPPEEMANAIDEYCVDGKDFYTGDHSWTSGFNALYIHISSKLVDAGSTYRQGSSVCSGTADWKGNIRTKDCKNALKAMNDRCSTPAGFWGSKYVYNCVQWSVATAYS